MTTPTYHLLLILGSAIIGQAHGYWVGRHTDHGYPAIVVPVVVGYACGQAVYLAMRG